MNNNKDLDALLEMLTQGQSDEELLMMSLQTDIAATISAVRVSKNISQKDLAQKLGVTQSLVSKWETGETNFTLLTLVRIALALGIEARSPFEPIRPQYRSVSHPRVIPFANNWGKSKNYENSWTGSKMESSKNLMEM